MGRNGVALLASWGNPSAERGGWGFGGRGAALLPPFSCPGARGAASICLCGLTWGFGLGVMARAEERWGRRTGGPLPF